MIIIALMFLLINDAKKISSIGSFLHRVKLIEAIQLWNRACKVLIRFLCIGRLGRFYHSNIYNTDGIEKCMR